MALPFAPNSFNRAPHCYNEVTETARADILRAATHRMILYILRHASAGTRRRNPLLDRKRGLDKEGKAQCLMIGAYLNALGISFDAIISSPLKRSLQTASMVATEIGFEQKIAADPSLEPAGRFADFEALLAKHAQQENVLVVGHNPNLAQFAGALIGQRGGRANLRFRKAGMARIDVSRRPGQLLGLVDTRSLRLFQSGAAKSTRRK
jgi:phosphohistidine phosphatase